VKTAEKSISSAPAFDVRDALAAAIARLETAGTPSAALAAELLMMHTLGCDRTWLYAYPEYQLSARQAAAYAALIEQRAAGVPTQYLTGRQEFWGMDFEVGPGVLIPRPETEHIIEVALARLASRRTEPLTIADVGTGSGCIAVALAHELPGARIVATDISPTALEFARRNAQRHGVSERVEFRHMNLLDGYLSNVAEQSCFDVIVSNPPYVGRSEAADLPREVREHEPPEALFAGECGLDAYPPLIAQAAKLIRPRGWLVVELGYSSADPVRALIAAQQGWRDVSLTNDLAGIPRVLAAEHT
jgi:release factor glutamine methyltransferase